MLETVLSVPGYKLSPWLVGEAVRHQDLAGRVNHRRHGFDVVALTGNQNCQVVSQPNEAAIKHPMRSSGQGEPVANDVGAVMLYRSDMSGFHLSATTTIDQTQASDGAAFAIGAQDILSEIAVANRAIGQLVDAFSSGHVLEKCLRVMKPWQLHRVAYARQDVLISPKTTFDYSGKVFS